MCVCASSDDRVPPQVSVSQELMVMEGGEEYITTDFLSASDPDSPPTSLHYTLIQPPKLGHLALAGNAGNYFIYFACSFQFTSILILPKIV